MTSDDNHDMKTRSEAVANVLREEIIDGQWAPNAKLKTEQLKDRFKVSSATVRDALFVLMAEFLVRLEGQKGFRVAPLFLADALDLARTRAIVESAALEDSLRTGGDKWEALISSEYFLLAKAEERVHLDPTGAIHEYERANDRFHEALVSASSSERLKTMRRTFFQEAKRYRRIVTRKADVRKHDKKEHEDLLQACLGRDIERAKHLIAQHVQTSVAGLTAADFAAAEAEGFDIEKAA